MKVLTVLLAGVLLSGCAQRMAARIPTDDEKCKSYGLQFGPPAYADCRMRAEQNRAQANAEATSALLGYMAASKPVSCQRFGNYASCS